MPPEKQNNDNLSSWKQIADYLGVSERTAQHWEWEKGLPVKRLTGSKGRVSADIADLERWKQANLKATPWYSNLIFLRYYGAITSGMLLLCAGIMVGFYFASNSKGPPADCRLEYETLIVTDESGQVLWKYLFPDPFMWGAYDQGTGQGLKRAWFGKLNAGDREVSVIFSYYPVTADKTGGELVCFSQKGKVKWRFKTDRTVSDLKGTYVTPYVVGDYEVAPIEEGGPNRIFVTSHTYGNPNQFVILDGNKELLGEYWHSGHLSEMEVVDFDGDGVKEVFLGGVNNGLGCAVLHVLDPRNVHGAFQQPAGDENQLIGFGKGTEIASILFPRTCISRKQQYNEMLQLSVQQNLIKVDVMEVGGDGNAFVIYNFGKNLTPMRPIVSDHLINIHATMRSRGELDHDFSESEVDELFNNLLKNIKKNRK